jgi:hypothetical protein
VLTCALPVMTLTSAADTPGTALSADSTDPEHAPHVMPLTASTASSCPAVAMRDASKPMSSTADTNAAGVTRPLYVTSASHYRQAQRRTDRHGDGPACEDGTETDGQSVNISQFASDHDAGLQRYVEPICRQWEGIQARCAVRT